jgi:hypothetical protein
MIRLRKDLRLADGGGYLTFLIVPISKNCM